MVVATSDQPALVRIKAAFTATAIAEYFRDQGQDVMLMMDSVTRFAMAQREVGLAIGEPPATRGYTPSVFALLPRLLERAGHERPRLDHRLYTVLVDGDDMNEPIADAVRSILDGHVVLTRELAHAGHYPAIDVLQSVSRLVGEIVAPEVRARPASGCASALAAYREKEDLISIGAYQRGHRPAARRARSTCGRGSTAFLRQRGRRAEHGRRGRRRVDRAGQRTLTPAGGCRRSARRAPGRAWRHAGAADAGHGRPGGAGLAIPGLQLTA